MALPSREDAAPAHIPLLTPSECGRVLERVQAHKDEWANRFPGLPFYTLGAASYLDTEEGSDDYYRKAARLNPLLEREFDWLYERLLATLSGHLGAEVAFEPRAARPGFHVFLAHEAFMRPLGRIHFDLQFEGLEWTEGGDFSRPVSYTLAIRLPRSGAGLQTWDVSKAEYDAMGPEERERIPRDRPAGYVPYREGAMVCHSGMLLHRIAPAREAPGPEDMRVTLQGHALPVGDGYRTYW